MSTLSNLAVKHWLIGDQSKGKGRRSVFLGKLLEALTDRRIN